jgi:hypothetical protein
MLFRRFAVGVLIGIAGALTLVGVCSPAKAVASPAKPIVKAKVPVVIQAYYPLNANHKYIAEYLTKFAKSHPKEVSIEIIDFQTSEGRKRWEKSGLTCAGLIINGKTTWDVKRGKRVDTIAFEKKMDVFWGRDDFEALVKQLVAKSKAK